MRWRDATGQDILPKTLPAAHVHKKNIFPKVKDIIITCTSEHSNSTLKLVGDRLCSTMGNDRLTGLSLTLVLTDIEIDPQKIISEFARRQIRKLELMNIISEC